MPKATHSLLDPLLGSPHTSGSAPAWLIVLACLGIAVMALVIYGRRRRK